MRRPVIAANWKMYKTRAETRAFFDAFKPLSAGSKHCDIIVAPPFTSITAAVEAAQSTEIGIAAQDMYWEREGAFTGEISARMLVEAGCRAVIVGHSERRQHFGETDAWVHRKTKAALEAGLTPIVCVGEMLAERDANRTEEVLKRQFDGALAALTPAEFSRIIRWRTSLYGPSEREEQRLRTWPLRPIVICETWLPLSSRLNKRLLFAFCMAAASSPKI